MHWLTRLWKAEPVIAGLAGNAAFWPVLFSILSATGHPISDPTQHAIVAGATLITGAAIRQTVTAPDTLADQIGAIKSVHDKVGV